MSKSYRQRREKPVHDKTISIQGPRWTAILKWKLSVRSWIVIVTTESGATVSTEEEDLSSALRWLVARVNFDKGVTK